MTYCQDSGSKPINWRVVIGYLRTITLVEYSGAEFRFFKEAANNYATSPVGNLCTSIPRISNGKPLDTVLGYYYLAFYDTIFHLREYAKDMFCGFDEQDMIDAGHNYRQSLDKADFILTRIEKRAAMLITTQTLRIL